MSTWLWPLSSLSSSSSSYTYNTPRDVKDMSPLQIVSLIYGSTGSVNPAMMENDPLFFVQLTRDQQAAVKRLCFMLRVERDLSSSVSPSVVTKMRDHQIALFVSSQAAEEELIVNANRDLRNETMMRHRIAQLGSQVPTKKLGSSLDERLYALSGHPVIELNEEMFDGGKKCKRRRQTQTKRKKRQTRQRQTRQRQTRQRQTRQPTQNKPTRKNS